MTREELKECNGFTVQILLDDKESFATLDSRDLSKVVIIPDPSSDKWEDSRNGFTLSDSDIASLRPNGTGNLFSKISLSKDGLRLTT